MYRTKPRFPQGNEALSLAKQRHRLRSKSAAGSGDPRRARCSLSGGGEGFFEDGLEEVGGVGAGVLDLGGQRSAMLHQRLHSLHDRGLLRERWERQAKIRYMLRFQVRLLPLGIKLSLIPAQHELRTEEQESEV